MCIEIFVNAKGGHLMEGKFIVLAILGVELVVGLTIAHFKLKKDEKYQSMKKEEKEKKNNK